MSDEKLSPSAKDAMKAAVLVEVLGDVAKLREEVGEIKEDFKALKLVIVKTIDELKEIERAAINALRNTGKDEKEKLASEAAKLVRAGVYSELGTIKTEIGKLIIDLNRAAEDVRSTRRWDYISYTIGSSLVIFIVGFFLGKIMFNH